MNSRLRSLVTALGLGTAAFLSLATSKPKEETSAEPVDAETAKYIGDWEGEGVTLSIATDKTFTFKKQKGSTSSSANGKVKAIQGGQIVVKAAFIELKYKVDVAPTEEDGVWTMTVDGNALTKRGAGAGKGASVKTKLEGSIATQFASKGITKVVCPASVTQPEFVCTATLKNGKTAPVNVKLKNASKGDYSFRTEVVDVDAATLATNLAELVAKETKGKLNVTVDCGTGKLYLPEGDPHLCEAVDKRTKKKGTVEAKFTGGDLHWSAKGF
ncbi:MAG: hypothetical protein IPF92_04330 [Myxococcales bacterium]|jgi:hypothetical protein|nr:hypothetical protein [Myxococcales bacterium]MBL0197795.1 hypothetical protein [Myxococcales bacterium]